MQPSQVFLLLEDQQHKLGTYDELVEEITELLRNFVGALRLTGRFSTAAPDPDQYCWNFTLYNFRARTTVMSAIEEIASRYFSLQQKTPSLKWIEDPGIILR